MTDLYNKHHYKYYSIRDVESLLELKNEIINNFTSHNVIFALKYMIYQFNN